MKARLAILSNLFIGGFVLALGVMIWLCGRLGDFCENRFGPSGRLIALGLALLFFFFVLMRNFYRILNWFDAQNRADLRKKHRAIYRVLALPAASKKPANWCDEEITIGDFGWESKPLTRDGLIWLHGLSNEWKMAWRAGFKPEEIEFVGPKPISQYDWKDFEYDGAKPGCIWTTAIPKHACPFPIQKATDRRKLQFPVSSC